MINNKKKLLFKELYKKFIILEYLFLIFVKIIKAYHLPAKTYCN